MTAKRQVLEEAIRNLTTEINDQYPRPWMTDLPDPSSATVFTVGKNQKNGYSARLAGTHEHYINTLFNRGNENCRQIYKRLVDRPSPTRENTEKIEGMLKRFGADRVLQTNVICYSTHSSRELKNAAHKGGMPLGVKIFDAVLTIIKPRVVIAHGQSTSEYLSIAIDHDLPPPPREACSVSPVEVNGTFYFIVPTLDPRHFRKWENWPSSDYPGLTYIEGVCRKAASLVGS